MADARLRLLLACLLLGAYLLVYTPRIDSIDGQALLAAAAAVARHGAPVIGAIGAQDALLPIDHARMTAFGVDGAPYTKKGLTPSLLLLPFVLAADALPWLGTRAAAMLSTPLVTTATALALYVFVGWLGYRPRTAFAVGLVYGLATLALPYVRTLYGEPLAALLLLLAVMGAFRARAGDWRGQALAGACLGLLAGVNLVSVALILAVAIYAWWPDEPAAFSLTRRLAAGWKDRLRAAAAFVLPLAACLALIGLYNWARFGSPLASGYHFASGEGFTRPLLEGLYGLWLGPYRGLAWYSPVLLLALPGWLMLRWARPGAAALLLALAAAQTLAYATWWSWEGGIAWGPRFLLVIVPLLAAMLAPLIEAAWTRRALLAAVIGFAGLSFGVQLLGTLYSIYPWVFWLYANFFDLSQAAYAPQVYTDPALSAITGHLALALAGQPLELSWTADGLALTQPLAGAALATVGGLLAWRAPRRAPALAGLAALAALSAVAAAQNRGEAHRRIAALQAALQPPGTVAAATTAFDETLLDLEIRAPVFSTNAPTAPDDRLAAALWRYGWAQGGRLWLVTWFPPADAANWQERDLWARATFGLERAAAGHRLLLFDLSPAPEPDRAAGHRFGPITLARYGVAQAADGLRVTVEWQAQSPPAGDYAWFVHVLDEAGQILAQQDRQPLGGYAPTSGWKPGQTVTDRLVFPGAFPPSVRLRIGWVNPAAGQRLPAFSPGGAPLAEDFVVLPL